MKEVILSHDSEAMLYAVPDEVADHLEEYCQDFADRWLWQDPRGAKYLREINGITVACYGAPDFIDYLNAYRFPDQPSALLRVLDCYGYDLPEAYAKKYPHFNF